MGKVKTITALLLGALSAIAAERPNILWITIEDTSPHFIGCYGDKNARTPNIDRLAREGVRFTNAYATGPVCSSSRSTIFTGARTYEMGTGNHRSEYPVPDYIKGFPYYMKEVGYFTSNNGKKDYNFADIERKKHEAWTMDGKVGWWNREEGQPFFCVFNHNDSHQSRTMSWSFEKYETMVLENLSPEQMIRDDQFEMPPFLKDSPEMRKQFARVYNSIRLTDIRIGELLKKLEDEGLRDDTIIFFYADHGEGIPRGKQNGINLSYQVPFIISIPEKWKNLSPWGTGGVTTDELISFEDLAPTLISMAGGKIPDHMNGRVFMGKDRAKPVDHLVFSADRCDNGIGLMRGVREGDWFYARNFMAYMPEERYKSYTEISDIMKQMRKDLAAGELNAFQESLFVPREPEFLFNLKEDLWEEVNLASDPKQQERLKKMRARLKDKLVSGRDVHLMPEYEIGQASKEGTIYEFRLDDKNYPIEKVYAAASLSGFRGADVTKKQVALLKDSNRFVRYWAAMGLMAQSNEDLAPYQAEIVKAMNDAYPPAGVTAAAVIWKNFETKAAEEKIKEYFQHEDWFIKLMAVNYLFYVDNREPFIDAVNELNDHCRKAEVEAAEKKRLKYVSTSCIIFFEILAREELSEPEKTDRSFAVTVSSEEIGFEGEKLIDGNPKTHWCTNWRKKAQPYPHEVQIDLGTVTELDGITCLSRQDGKSHTHVRDYEIYVSADGKTWGEPLVAGTLENSAELQTVPFPARMQTRAFKIKILNGYEKSPFSAMAEIGLMFSE